MVLVRPSALRLSVALVLTASLGMGCTSKASHPSPGGSGERIVYRVEDTTVSPAAVTTSVVEVSRPYIARTMTYDGPTTSAPLLSGSIWTSKALYNVTATGAIQQTQLVPPAPAPPATRLDVALPIAESQRIVRKTGQSMVDGRPCTLWMSKEPLDGLAFAPATAADHTTTCVAPDGDLLSDTWFIGGKQVRVRTATAVQAIPALTESTVFASSPTPVPPGISEEAVEDIALDAQGFGITLPAPSGFTLDRSVRITRSIAGDPAPVVVRTGEVDSYVSGQQVIVLRRTKDVVGAAIAPTRGARVDIGALGSGRLEAVATGCRVTVATKAGVLVVADSTTQPDTLLAWLRQAKLT